MIGSVQVEPRRRRRGRRDSEREILEAAERVLRERPFRELTVDDLMAATSQSRTAFYRHFTDRQDLSHTVGIEQMKEKLKSTPVQVYVIGAGETINRQDLTMLGRTGVFLSNDPAAFKKVSKRSE